MAWLSAGTGQPTAWVDGGWPKLVPVLLLLLAPLMLSGAIRAALGVGLGAGLLLGTLVTLLLARLNWPWIRAEARAYRFGQEVTFELVALIPVAYALAQLYDPNFQGLPTIDGWDAGTHTHLRHSFLASKPDEYHGFVTFYSVSHWLERALSLDAFRSFAVTSYLSVVGYVVFPVLLAVAHLRRQRDLPLLSILIGALLATGVELYLLDRIALPLIHYGQAAGYYPLTLVLLPIFLLWASDALVKVESLRVLGILVAVGLVRFTYGLNLPDVMVAGAGVLLLGTPRTSRGLVQTTLALGLVAGALAGYVLLLPRFSLKGGLLRFDVDAALASHLLIGAVLALYLFLSRREGDDDGALVRGLRFPLIFVLVSSAAWSWFRSNHPPQDYYLTKYQVASSLLLVPACTLVAADVVARVARAMSRVAAASVFGVLRPVHLSIVLVVAMTPWGRAYEVYAATLRERNDAKGPPYALLRPLADPEAMARIQQTLAVEKKQFGGYLVSWYPMFNFMNGALGHYDAGEMRSYFAPRTDPGHCVFWVSWTEDILGSGRPAVERYLAPVVKAGPPTCVTYPVSWKTTVHSLCHRCF